MSDNEYNVWVGCLACYNEGRLVGDWFPAADCPQDQEEFEAGVKCPPGHHNAGYPHEEFWVMDHENSPVQGEYSPMDAARYAEWLGDVDGSELPALLAYIRNDGTFDEGTVERFRDAYQGEYDSDQDFAQELADELGLVNAELSWPHSCIDWEHAARELMYDYFSENGYYFRSL